MKKFTVLFSMFFLFASSLLQAEEIENIVVEQRTDGSGMVDIYFDIVGTGSNIYNITLEVSFDGAEPFDLIDPVYYSGSVRGVQEGSHYIAWNGMVSHPGIDTEAAVLKITADFVAGPVSYNGHVYPVTVIGEQVWFARNLQTEFYANGEPILRFHPKFLEEPPFDPGSETYEGYYYVYPYRSDEADGLNTEQELINAYGLHYNYLVIMDDRGVCPDGWRVPNKQDWDAMTDYLLEQHFYDGATTENISSLLVSCRTMSGGNCQVANHPYWEFMNADDLTNLSGLNLLPAGQASADPLGNAFLTFVASFWAIDTNYGDNSYGHLTINDSDIGFWDPAQEAGSPDQGIESGIGFSIRCIKDLD